MVGQITVNWAAADHILGRVLEDVIYHLGEGEAAREVGADLIHGINMRRKLDLIKRHRRRLPDENEIDTIMSELKSACEKEKVFRNMLAHGILLFDPDGNGVFYSQRKKNPWLLRSCPVPSNSPVMRRDSLSVFGFGHMVLFRLTPGLKSHEAWPPQTSPSFFWRLITNGLYF